MTIVILKTVTDTDLDTGQPVSRGVTIWISDGTTNYIAQVGNLPLTGALLPGLQANEAAIWADAVAAGLVATETETEIAGAIQVYMANPGMKAAVFDKTLAQEDSDITALIAALFPSANATLKTGLKQLLMSSLLDTRVNARDRELV